MDQPDLTRSIRATFDGPDIGPGWIPVPDLLAVLEGLQSAMTVIVEDLWGRTHTRGRVPTEIQQSATLKLGDVRVGSFGATLQLERPPTMQPEMFDVQPEAVDRLMGGIEAHVAGRETDLPGDAIRHLAAVTSRIRRSPDSLTLEGGSSRRRVILSAETVTAAEVQAPLGPRKVRLSGRLLEIDYRDHSAEVWDPLGRMTRFRFTDEQRAQVDAARQQHVTVEGVVETGPTGRPGPLSLEAVTVAGGGDMFWRSPSLADLASAQGVRPIASPAELHAPFWPEDDEEDFLASVRRWRQEA